MKLGFVGSKAWLVLCSCCELHPFLRLVGLPCWVYLEPQHLIWVDDPHKIVT